MAYQSLGPEGRAQLAQAFEWGLVAAAQVYINRVKRDLRGGYTVKLYATGNVINSVTRTQLDPMPAKTYELADGRKELTPTVVPAKTPDGREIRVGTNVMYALYWELGWTPASYHAVAGLAGGEIAAPLYRVPIWLPALREEQRAMQAAFKRGFDRVMGAAA
jgi:hypothetical protein